MENNNLSEAERDEQQLAAALDELATNAEPEVTEDSVEIAETHIEADIEANVDLVVDGAEPVADDPYAEFERELKTLPGQW